MRGEFGIENSTTHNVEPLTRLGRNLRDFRRQMNMSQQVAGDRVGIMRATLSKYEVGHAQPALKILASFAMVYETTVADLLAGVPAEELL